MPSASGPRGEAKRGSVSRPRAAEQQDKDREGGERTGVGLEQLLDLGRRADKAPDLLAEGRVADAGGEDVGLLLELADLVVDRR